MSRCVKDGVIRPEKPESIYNRVHAVKQTSNSGPQRWIAQIVAADGLDQWTVPQRNVGVPTQ